MSKSNNYNIIYMYIYVIYVHITNCQTSHSSLLTSCYFLYFVFKKHFGYIQKNTYRIVIYTYRYLLRYHLYICIRYRKKYIYSTKDFHISSTSIYFLITRKLFRSSWQDARSFNLKKREKKDG